MANVPLNSKDVFLYAKETTITSGQDRLVACLTDSDLQQQKNEIDASSKCGSYFLPGTEDKTFNATLQVLDAGAYTGTVGAKELQAAYDGELSVTWTITDDILSSSKYFAQFSGKILSLNLSFPNEGVVTADISIKVDGAIDWTA
jgi:hypothetical protein